MKLLKLGVVLVAVIAAVIAVASVSYTDNRDNSDNKPAFNSMNIFKEKECFEDSGEEICTETLYAQDNNGNKIPLMSGYAIRETVIVPKYIEKEKIVVQEKKFYGEERQSPADRIKDDDINVFGNSVNIDIRNAGWRSYIDSNSMDPLIDNGTTTIEIKPKYANEINVGDIIAYDVDGYDYAFVHRVVEIGNDGEGVYFITKGDNYWKEDPYKVRFSQVKGVVVGILY